VFWALSNHTRLATRPTVLLNGQPLAGVAEKTSTRADQIALDDVRFVPRALIAKTAYTLQLKYGPSSALPESVFEIHFTTGSGPAPSASKSRVRVMAHADYPQPEIRSRACPDVLAAQGCLDPMAAPPARLHVFETRGGQPMAWFLRSDKPDASQLWPSVCGHPELLLPESRADECFELQPIAAGGALQPTIRYCTRADKRSKHAFTGRLDTPAVGIRPVKPVRVVPMAGSETTEAQVAPPPVQEPAPAPAAGPVPAPAEDRGCSVSSTAHREGANRTLLWRAIALLPLLLPGRARLRQ
jgi:hypothetical protein